MLEHVVLMKPKANVGTDAIAALWAGLGGLRHLIAGIVDIAVGDNVNSEGKDLGFTLGFIVTFESRAALDDYLPHPEHLAVVPLVRAIADDTLVFDLERD